LKEAAFHGSEGYTALLPAAKFSVKAEIGLYARKRRMRK